MGAELVGAVVDLLVGVGEETWLHTQSVSLPQKGFRQKPLIQARLLLQL